MKKLIWGVGSLVFAANLASAQSVSVSVNNTPEFTQHVTAKVDTFPKVGKQQNSDDPMRSKTFTKTFSLDNSDKVNISNRYGDVLVKTWDRREIKVDVEVKAYSKDDDDVQKLLDDVSIDASKNGDVVSFKTNFGDNNGRYGSSTRNGKTVWRREVRINYVVYMPHANALTLNNQYGNVNIGNFAGALYAKVQYGNFTGGNLSSSNNYIAVQYGTTNIQELNKAIIKHQYGSGLTIGTVGSLELNVQYAGANVNTIKGNAIIKQQYGSGLTIGSVDNLDLDAQYATVNVNNISGNATIKQQYNNVTLGSVGKLNLRAQYATAKIGTLKGDGTIRISYNRLNIDNITTGCKSLNIDADYTPVSLAFSSNYQGEFDVRTSYAGFKAGGNVSSRQEGGDRDDQTKMYSGKIGNGGSAKVFIKADYGSVSIR